MTPPQEVRAEFTLKQGTQAQTGSKGTPLLYNLSARWGWVVNATARPLYSFLTVALEGGEWPAARPGRTLPPGKTRYPLYRRLGGPQCRSGRTENLVPTGIRSPTVQPVVSHYTD